MVMLNPVQQKGFRQLFDAVGDSLFVVDAGGAVVALNPEAERLFGWTVEELVGTPFNRIFPPRFHQATHSQPPDTRNSTDGPNKVPVHLFARRRDETEFPVELSQSLLDPGEDPLELMMVRDLTRERRAHDTLFREKERASVTLASISDAIVTTDLAGSITYMNPTAERLTGWRTNEALGQPFGTVLALIHEASRQLVENIPARCLREGRAVDLTDGVLLIRRDGTEMAIGESTAPIRDRSGAIIGVVLVFHDVTERRRENRRLSHEATHDSLTGLISRKEFEQRLARSMAELAVSTSEHVLCYVDLDRFKLVNDTCGHEAGDDLLRTISSLLTSRLRSRDTVGRLGGDEFGILLEHCSLSKAEEIAGKLVRAIADLRYEWRERSFSVGASIGVVPITLGKVRTADVLRAADHACYAAKSAGGDRVHIAQEVDAGVGQRMEDSRMTRLSRVMKEGGLHLFVQPIVPLAPQHLGHPRCEILLRLPDENGGEKNLDSFFPDTGRYPLTSEVDRWVVRQSVELIDKWQQGHPDHELPFCSIGLNVASMDDADLIPMVRESLALFGLPPQTLCFEITETTALDNVGRTMRLISEIRAAGCGVALDDFGCGMNSFVNLKGLPVDYVKVGGAYVRGVSTDPVYGALLRTVNEISRIMGIATIASEVEDDIILQGIRSLGLEYAQGHAVAPAQPMIDADGNVILPSVARRAA